MPKPLAAHMLEALSMYSDEMMELLLSEEEVPKELIYKVTRDAVLGGATPVYMGTAFKNKGVQPLLDAVIRYLPSPLDREIYGRDPKDEEKKIELKPDPKAPFVGMAFKIVDDPFGQLTFMRIYQGTIEKGETYVNQRTGRKERFSRIVRMHSDKREEIDSASAGDIVAIMGIDSASGDTYGDRARSVHAGIDVRSRSGDQDRGEPNRSWRRRQDGQSTAAVPQGRPDVPCLHRRRNEAKS